MMSIATSRLLLSALLGLILAGCTATASSVARSAQSQPSVPVSITNYRTQVDEKFPVPAVDTEKLKTRNMRQLVDYPTNHPPGTLVVDTKHRFVYLVQEGGKALRYGVGVGREGVEFTGSVTVGLKREWPRWTPTPDMIKREPERYAQWADGMQGGPQNPLGARDSGKRDLARHRRAAPLPGEPAAADGLRDGEGGGRAALSGSR